MELLNSTLTQPNALRFFLLAYRLLLFAEQVCIQGHTCHIINELTAELGCLFIPSVVLGVLVSEEHSPILLKSTDPGPGWLELKPQR